MHPVDRIPLVGALLLGVWFGGAGCHRESPAGSPSRVPRPSVAVRVAEVTAGGDPVQEEVVGTVRSRQRALVEAKVAGRVEAVRAVPGQRVAAGEVLVVLDAREWAARREQSQAAREQAERDLDRLTRLVREGAATPSELDAARSRQRMAVAADSEAETLLGYARVAAPFDGVVSRKLVEVGDLAIPGRPLLEVEDPGRLRFETDVPEALVERIVLGARFPIRVASQTVPVEGAVSEVAPVADPATRTVSVRLDLPSPGGLRAGQFGRLLVPTGPPSGAHVPASAVLRRGQMELVYVVEEGKAHLRLVRTGRRSGNRVELVSGVALGERVVMENAGQLHDGQEVTIL